MFYHVRGSVESQPEQYHPVYMYCQLNATYLVMKVFLCASKYRTLAKVRPWALHLTFSPNRGVGALSSVSAFNLERVPTFVYVHK